MRTFVDRAQVVPLFCAQDYDDALNLAVGVLVPAEIAKGSLSKGEAELGKLAEDARACKELRRRVRVLIAEVGLHIRPLRVCCMVHVGQHGQSQGANAHAGKAWMVLHIVSALWPRFFVEQKTDGSVSFS